jgi:hypothetical protein
MPLYCVAGTTVGSTTVWSAVGGARPSSTVRPGSPNGAYSVLIRVDFCAVAGKAVVACLCVCLDGELFKSSRLRPELAAGGGWVDLCLDVL